MEKIRFPRGRWVKLTAYPVGTVFMRRICAIGKSKGILLPLPILAQFALKDRIELQPSEGQLILRKPLTDSGQKIRTLGTTYGVILPKSILIKSSLTNVQEAEMELFSDHMVLRKARTGELTPKRSLASKYLRKYL